MVCNHSPIINPMNSFPCFHCRTRVNSGLSMFVYVLMGLFIGKMVLPIVTSHEKTVTGILTEKWIAVHKEDETKSG